MMYFFIFSVLFRKTDNYLYSLSYKFVSRMGVRLVHDQASAAGSSQREVRSLALHGSIGEADLPAQFCTGDFGRLVT